MKRFIQYQTITATKYLLHRAFSHVIDLCGSDQARYATTDARTHADYVVTDTPAPPADTVPSQA